MVIIYTAYEAKAKLSELLRHVQAGRSVRVTLRGETVAEVRPIPSEDVSFAEHLRHLEREGVLIAAKKPVPLAFPALQHVPGAVQRFLDERE